MFYLVRGASTGNLVVLQPISEGGDFKVVTIIHDKRGNSFYNANWTPESVYTSLIFNSDNYDDIVTFAALEAL